MTRGVILGGILRVCRVFSSLAGITILWVLCSVPIVTLPLATVALYDAVARMLDGESPSWRRFIATMRERASAAAVGVAVLAIPSAISTALLQAAHHGAGPATSGAAAAMLIITGLLAVIAPYACLTASGPETVARQLGFLIAGAPIRALLAGVPWVAMAALILAAPIQISTIVAVVSVSLPALGSVAILTIGTRARTLPRTRGSRSVLQFTSKGITQ